MSRAARAEATPAASPRAIIVRARRQPDPHIRRHHRAALDACGSDQMVTPLAGRMEPWPLHMFLDGPRHQGHAHRDGAFIDFLLSDFQHGVWHYRRHPAIMRAVDRMALFSDAGLPFLAPELALIYTSKNTSTQQRSKDQSDFDEVCAKLEPERKAWLPWALIATDDAHPWIERLA